MQKVLKRTAQAEKQALRRQAKQKWCDQREELANRKAMVGQITKEVNWQMKKAREARRENWEMGPLAPKRDVPWLAPSPFKTDSQNYFYGSISNSRTKPYWDWRPEEADARTAWAGGVRNICLKEGDRVVITEGPDKGKIGSILDLDAEKGLVQVKGCMQNNISIPEHAVTDGGTPVRTTETYIPVDAVRLVHPLTDPTTGRTRDVIIRQLQPMSLVVDKVTRKRTYERIVPGLNVTIPWPTRADGAPAEPVEEDHAGDTLRLDVEPNTYVPTLLTPPMPEGLIDELRGKYSRFRTRHEPEYIARKEAEDAEKKARRTAQTMMTPLQEFHVQQKALRRARGQPVLSEEMLERIGEVMAKNKIALGGTASTGRIHPPSPDV